MRVTCNRFFFATLVAAATAVHALSPACSRAEYIPPDRVQVKTKTYTPAGTKFPAGTYEYSLNWQGIPVGSATITVTTGSACSQDDSAPECSTVTARARTGSVIRIFYDLNHLSESVFRADSFTPVRFHSVQTENSKTKSREVTFARDGRIRGALYKGNKEEPEEEVTFESTNQTFDPISASFLARSLPIVEGEELSFDVFNGKHRFLITMKVVGKEKIKVGKVKRDAFKVQPTVKKLTDSEGEKRLHAAMLWISADENRDVLKIKSRVAVGSVNAELVRFKPAAPLPDAAARAALKAPEGEPQPAVKSAQ